MTRPRDTSAPASAARRELERALTVVEHQPVGVLIVDEETVVTYANRSAIELLGVERARLVGEVFGHPLAPGPATDVNVAGEAGSVRTLTLHVTPLPGDGGERLVSLVDVSGRVRVYEHEHRLVETLQRSLLLEQLPEIEGVRLAARYVPGEGDVRVGGDWYDAMHLRDGTLGLVIGDVAGHGIGSAALMSQLRNALRAYALEHASPADVVLRLDGLLSHLEPRGMATIVYLVFDPRTRILRLTSAGHPYPLLVGPDGRLVFVRGGRALPLGARQRALPPVETVAMEPGATLVLYTDGLIERRGRPLDEGFARLAELARTHPGDPDELCEAIIGGLVADEAADDVAVLVMRT